MKATLLLSLIATLSLAQVEHCRMQDHTRPLSCMLCEQGFMLSADQSQCTQCTNGLCPKETDWPDTYPSKPLLDCPQGYFISTTGSCIACPLCFTCANSGADNTAKCTSCVSGSNLDPATNCSACITGYFLNGTNNTCIKCPTYCTACYAANNGSNLPVCTSCSDINMNSINGSCVCKSGYFQLLNGQCSPCSTLTNCAQCSNNGSDAAVCTACSGSHFNITTNGQCTCQFGYYSNSATTCAQCPVKCTSCTNPTTCLTCADANMILANQCSCPTTMFLSVNMTQCINCTIVSPACTACTNTGNDSQPACTTCSGANMVILNGMCSCSNTNYYMVNNSLSCNACPNYCNSCLLINNVVTCLTCLASDPYLILLSDSSNCGCKPSYFMSTSCTACPSTCLSCSNINTCTTCVDANMIISLGLCTCKTGYMVAPNQLSCVSCSDGCTTCTNSTSNKGNCTACINDANIVMITSSLGNFCQCKSGFFFNGTSCVACIAPCQSCVASGSSSICLSCTDPNMQVINGLCKCPAGYFTNANNVCSACLSTCITCTTLTTCDTCIQDTNILAGPPTCTCKSGYYPHMKPAYCSICPLPCTTCSNNGNDAYTCSSCIDAINMNAASQCQCNTGFYMSKNQVICLSCPLGCTSCTNNQTSNDDSPICQTCTGNATSTNGACVCNNGYAVNTLGTCVDCTTLDSGLCGGCSSTFGVLACTSCAISTTSYILNGHCTCNPAFYQTSLTPATCVACKMGCNKCTSNACQNCLENTTMTIQADGSCLCNAGYYMVMSPAMYCAACPIGCNTCTASDNCCSNQLCCTDSILAHLDSTSKICACATGFIRFYNKGTCLDTSLASCGSQSAYILNTDYSNPSVTNPTLQCAPTSTVSGGQYAPVMTDTSGNIYCAPSFIGDAVTSPLYCVACPANCPTSASGCTYSSSTTSKCSSCSKAGFNSDCASCSSAYFMANNNGECDACSGSNSYCTTCSNFMYSNYPMCSGCSISGANFNLVSCLCNIGYYLNTTSGPSCAFCPSTCTACTGSTVCTACTDPAMATPACACPNGYYISGTNCQPCGQGCSSCGSATACGTCFDSTLIPQANNNSCVCKNSNSAINANGTSCITCPTSCTTCTLNSANIVACQNCKDTNMISSQNCAVCIAGYILNSMSTSCLQCSATIAGCTTCVNNGNDNITCTACISPLVISSQNKCNCPSGYVFYATTSTCVQCPPSCTACTIDGTGVVTGCTSCSDANMANTSTSTPYCVCSQGYYLSNPTQCTACFKSCKACSMVQSTLTCTTCMDSVTQTASGSTCVCNAGYFMAINGATCYTCGNLCPTCVGNANNQPVCTTCVSNAAISATSCICLNGYFASSTTACTQCSPACSQCNSLTNCTSCINDPNIVFSKYACSCAPGYFLNNNQCTPCPLGCLSCTSTTVCTGCIDNNMQIVGQLCVCNTSFFLSVSGIKCLACSQLCPNCSNSNLDTPYCNTCVDTNMINNGGTCTCNAGYYLSVAACIACSAPCGSCLSPTSCLTCSAANSFLSNTACQCYSGYFMSGTVCQPCGQLCSSCSSSTICNQCTDPSSMTKTGNTCSCSTGYYISANNAYCIKCPPSCTACTNSGSNIICSTCADNHMSGNSCTCQTGYYLSLNGTNCLQCLGTCVGSNCVNDGNNGFNCTTCPDPLMVVINGACVCKSGTYLDAVMRTNCVACSLSCVNCTAVNLNGINQVSCGVCQDPAYMKTGLLQCACNDGFYLASNSLACSICPTACTTCVNSGYGPTCTTCYDTNAIIVNGSCACKSGYAQQSNGKSCQACLVGCATCSLSNCITCTDSAHMTAIGTGCQCISQYFLLNVGTSCSACPVICPQNCTNNGVDVASCQKCVDTNMNLNNGVCTCKSGTYLAASGNLCLTCPVQCSNCALIGGILACSTCLDNNMNKSAQCQCNSGFYLLSNNISCGKCPNGCSTCHNNGLNSVLCSVCTSNSMTIINGLCQCTGSTFLSSDQVTCRPCQSNCLACVNSQVNDAPSCIQCVSDPNISPVNGTCTCAIGFFMATNTTTCLKCINMCATCQNNGLNGQKCITCMDVNSVVANSACICNTYFYSSIDNSVCLNCPKSCYSCHANSFNLPICDTCNDVSMLVTSNCQCSSNTYINMAGNKCFACPLSCTSCINNGFDLPSCSIAQCSDAAMVLSNLICICPNGKYTKLDGKSCLSCPSSCFQCNNDGQNNAVCTICKDTKMNAANQCSCLAGYYLTSSNLCGKCPSSCTNCSAGVANAVVCNSCLDYNMILLNGVCTCNFGYFISLSGGMCYSCSKSCTNCYNDGQNNAFCTTCQDVNMVILSGTCFCRTSYFMSNNSQSCIKCPVACNACVNSYFNTAVCTQCTDNNMMLNNNTCKCQSNFFVAINQTSCIACDPSCAVCTNNGNNVGNCSSCANPYMAYNTSSGTCFCSTGYYPSLDNKKCSLCPSTCKTCVNSKGDTPSCTLCQDAKMLLSLGACTCPTLSFASNSGASCISCDPSCFSCVNSGNDTSYCKSCTDPRSTYNQITGTCTCPSAMYFSLLDMACDSCDGRCASCKDSTNNCIACSSTQYIIRNSNGSCDCQSPYKFYEGQCVKSIPTPTNYFLIILIGVVALAGIIALIVVLLVCK